MTEWLYLEDSYVRSFQANVVKSAERGIVLDRSAFYPRGGGQPSDHGQLRVADGAQWQVIDLVREGDQVLHVLDGDPSLREGQEVHGDLDWERRYRLMRTHTALHMLSGVIFRDHGASVTGGNMEPGQGRLDFELGGLERDMVAEIEERLNAEVTAARPIRIRILPRDEAFRIPDLIRTKVNLIPEHVQMIRIVDIDGLDLQADGGTHVANTREVGPLRIVGYKSKGRSNKRLHIKLADELTDG
jgi:misacylated tRNA(Ala) deacylase